MVGHTEGVGDSHRQFVSYIDKSRDYYAAQGYNPPYRWAREGDTPFAVLDKPLADARIGVVTTARLPGTEPDVNYFAASQPQPQAMETDHLSWHKTATNTDDVSTFLPLDHLTELVENRTVGSLNTRFFGVPTLYSPRRTEQHAAELVAWATSDKVDLMLLIPL